MWGGRSTPKGSHRILNSRPLPDWMTLIWCCLFPSQSHHSCKDLVPLATDVPKRHDDGIQAPGQGTLAVPGGAGTQTRRVKRPLRYDGSDRGPLLRTSVPCGIVMCNGGRWWPRRCTETLVGRLPDDETSSPTPTIRPAAACERNTESSEVGAFTGRRSGLRSDPNAPRQRAP